MKHSLSDRAVGQIFVNLRPAVENSFVLSVSDDGAPLAADVQTHFNGAGLNLIARLAGQLAGKLRVEAAPKKRFSVIVPMHTAACG